MEAVHANHPELNKRDLNNTAGARNNLTSIIKDARCTRDDFRSKNKGNLANVYDNNARIKSQSNKNICKMKMVGKNNLET